MTLKNSVDEILKQQKRSLSWLAAEMDRTLDGFKLSLSNETLKFSDLKKMLKILNVPITVLFEGNTTVQKVKGSYNITASNSHVNEDKEAYKKEVEHLRDAIAILKSSVEDKDKIIELLNKQIAKN